MCQKRAFASRREAQQGARRAAELNGHGMRAYRCDRCSAWHITARTSQHGGDRKILPWRRVNDSEFAAPFGTGEFRVFESRDGWRALCPDGTMAGPFRRGLGAAKQWCDATSFLPEDRWAEVARLA